MYNQFKEDNIDDYAKQLVKLLGGSSSHD